MTWTPDHHGLILGRTIVPPGVTYGANGRKIPGKGLGDTLPDWEVSCTGCDWARTFATRAEAMAAFAAHQA